MSQFMVTNTLDDGAGSLRSQTSQPDVDAAGGQYGRTITWTYQVTNTGSADAPAPKATGADTTDQDFALIISNANVYDVDGDGQDDLVARALTTRSISMTRAAAAPSQRGLSRSPLMSPSIAPMMGSEAPATRLVGFAIRPWIRAMTMGS